MALTPPLLQACGGGEGGKDRELVISNFPLYIDVDAPGVPGSVSRFQNDTGIQVRYVEDVNDVRQFFARIQPQLAAGRPLAQDLIVLTGWMAERLIRLGWMEPLPLAEVPNARNLVPSLRKPSWDPEQRFSLPWQSGIAGIAYNIKATGRELRGIDDLFDPALKGRVSALLEMRDTMGLLMLADGQDITRPTWAAAQPSFDRLEQARKDGQIRRFTGNDYQTDLLAGNLAACIGWSGDVAQLAMEQPDLRFLVPDSGGVLWADVMLMPQGRPPPPGGGALAELDLRAGGSGTHRCRGAIHLPGGRGARGAGDGSCYRRPGQQPADVPGCGHVEKAARLRAAQRSGGSPLGGTLCPYHRGLSFGATGRGCC